jgi:group I intron endonuclease
MDCGIYRILNKVNNKCYIGSSVNVKDREYKHFWMLRNSRHDNLFLQNSYTKYGYESFTFEVLELCATNLLVERENYYINKFNSCDPEFGYNQALVNDFRRNTYNDSVKIKLSKYNSKKNNNFNSFSLTNIETNAVFIFDNLVEAANYLIENNFASGKARNVRQKLSWSLRGNLVNNGSNGSIRKTCYKHKFKIIN